MENGSVDPVVHERSARVPKSNVSSTANGSLERVDCERSAGWAWDPQQPDTPISVEVYVDDNLVATVRADQLRRELVLNLKGNGKHGFVVETPAALKDGVAHQIRVKIAGPRIELRGSPKVLTCPELEAR